MRIEHDKEVDAAYIYATESIGDREAVKTIELNENIILDFDKDDNLLGIEVLNASKVLSRDILIQAQ